MPTIKNTGETKTIYAVQAILLRVTVDADDPLDWLDYEEIDSSFNVSTFQTNDEATKKLADLDRQLGEESYCG